VIPRDVHHLGLVRQSTSVSSEGEAEEEFGANSER
jgi:hypothetical protein